MTVLILKDVYFSSEIIPLQCRLDGSKFKGAIDSISVDFVEDVMLRNLGERADWTITRVLSTQCVPNIAARQTKNQVLSVELSGTNAPVNPDVASRLIQCILID